MFVIVGIDHISAFNIIVRDWDSDNGSRFSVLDTEDLIVDYLSCQEICRAIELLGAGRFLLLSVDDRDDKKFWSAHSLEGLRVNSLGWSWVSWYEELTFRGSSVCFDRFGVFLRWSINGNGMFIAKAEEIETNMSLSVDYVEALQDLYNAFAVHYIESITGRFYIVVVDNSLRPLGVFIQDFNSMFKSMIDDDICKSFVAKRKLLLGSGWWDYYVK